MPRLIVMDVDSTFIRDEVVDLLAEHAAVGVQVADITERAMRGELDFEQSLRQRVGLLRGLPVTVLSDVVDQITLTPGARELTAAAFAAGHHVALVSGGFQQVLDPIAASVGIVHARANLLEVDQDVLTGGLVGRIVDRAEKARTLRELAAELNVDLCDTVAIGDGANDLDMVTTAGLGIAFNAKPALRQAADVVIDERRLDAVLPVLGW